VVGLMACGVSVLVLACASFELAHRSANWRQRSLLPTVAAVCDGWLDSLRRNNHLSLLSPCELDQRSKYFETMQLEIRLTFDKAAISG
jgi:hypothetical protein